MGCVCLAMTINMLAQSSTPSEAQTPQKFTLESCLQYAEEHNLSLQSSALNINASQINYKQARENIAPSVNGTISQGLSANNYEKSLSWNGNYGINAGMTLFNGLSNYNSIKQSKLQIEQSELELEQNKNEIRIAITQAFLNIMKNQDLLTYQEDVLKSSKEQLEQGTQQFKVGQILESDFKMLQAQYTSDLYNIENTRINIQNSILALKQQLSIDPSYEIEIVRPDSATLFKSLEIPALQEVVTRCNNYLPGLRISSNDIVNAQYNVKLQKANYYPSLSMSAGVSTGYNSINGANNLGWGKQVGHGIGEQVGLTLNVPIYQRSNVRHSVQLAELRLQQAELEHQETEQTINQEIYQYYLLLLSAQNDYTVADAQKEAYHANFETYSYKFKYGSVTTVELIQQQTNYLNQLNQFMQAKYQFILERKILDVYMGVPVSF